jgi:lipopolysaccharide/colanic/teichoic acid biosynthesis glycosyltransferase
MRQQQPVRRRSLPFSSLFASRLASRDYDFYGEAEFNAHIRVERRRTERTKKPLLLVLIDIRGLEKDRGRIRAIERIAYALCSCSRKIDIKGCYKSNAIFGIVFTELPDTVRETKQKLVEKLMRTLSGALRPDELQKIKISQHSFPEEEKDDGTSGNIFDLYLYPDLTKRNGPNRLSLILKRLTDLIGSAVCLIGLAPLFAAIAIGVKYTSPGPVLFRQRRMGASAKEFTLLKFRSMETGNDPQDHIAYLRKYIRGDLNDGAGGRAGKAVFKITDDRRVTPFGRLLRKTSLDELPQFINVLKGDMSLVGPRPPIRYEYEHYDIWHRRRVLEVKPGLTGLWQVKGRSVTAFDEMVRLDLQYARERSFWLDLKILLQTPAMVIGCKGAY